MWEPSRRIVVWLGLRAVATGMRARGRPRSSTGVSCVRLSPPGPRSWTRFSGRSRAQKLPQGNSFHYEPRSGERPAVPIPDAEEANRGSSLQYPQHFACCQRQWQLGRPGAQASADMCGIRIALSGPTFGAELDDMCGPHEPGLREVGQFPVPAMVAILMVPVTHRETPGRGPARRSPRAPSAGPRRCDTGPATRPGRPGSR